MYAIKRQMAAKAAWFWVVAFSRNKTRYYKRFYELKHGGSDLARAAAVAWRDEQLRQVKVLTVAEFCEKRRSNNTSGVPGVVFLTSKRQPQGLWQARLKLANAPLKSKSFSVRQYGFAKACELAIAARQAMLEAAGDIPYVHDPVALRFAEMQAPAAEG